MINLLEGLLPKGLQSKYYHVLILNPNDAITSQYLKPTTDNAFIIKEKRYEIHQSFIYRVGLWKTPTLCYVYDKPNPIDWRKQRKDEMSATDNYERMETRVAQDALRAFASTPLLTTSQMLMLIIMGGGFAFLYYTFNNKFETVLAMLSTLINGTPQ